MKYYSELSYRAYLSAMKEQMGSFTDFGCERFTGVILGRFFSITYHSGHEFNRRISNEKHRAIGFARASGEGTLVTCVRLAGMTNPASLIGMFLFSLLIFLLKGGIEIISQPVVLIICGLMSAVVGLITAFTDSITTRGQEGSKLVTAFLLDPTDYYSLVNRI